MLYRALGRVGRAGGSARSVRRHCQYHAPPRVGRCPCCRLRPARGEVHRASARPGARPPCGSITGRTPAVVLPSRLTCSTGRSGRLISAPAAVASIGLLLEAQPSGSDLVASFDRPCSALVFAFLPGTALHPPLRRLIGGRTGHCWDPVVVAPCPAPSPPWVQVGDGGEARTQRCGSLPR